MALKALRINSFLGMTTDVAACSLPLQFSPDACNMDTSQGKLRTVNGCSRVIATPFGYDNPRRLLVLDREQGRHILVFTDSAAFCYDNVNQRWQSVYTFHEPDAGTTLFDFQLAKVASDERLIIANGRNAPLSWQLDCTSEALPLSTGEQLSFGTVNFLELYFNRLFAAGDPEHGARLYWSKAPGEDRTIADWQVDEASADVGGGFVDVGTDSDPITGIFALSNQLVIFKRDSLYRLLGDRPSNYRIIPVDASFSQPIHTACIKRGDRLYFLTSEGLCFFDGQTVVHPRYKQAMQGVLCNADLSCCKASCCQDKLYFAIRENASSPYNDAVIEFDTVRESYMLRRGFQVVDLCAAHGRQYLMLSNGAVCVLDDSQSYDGAPINAHWSLPPLAMDTLMTNKQLLELYAQGCGVLEVTVRVEGFQYTDSIELTHGTIGELALYGEGRVAQLTLKNQMGGPLELDFGVELLMDVQKRIL